MVGMKIQLVMVMLSQVNPERMSKLQAGRLVMFAVTMAQAVGAVDSDNLEEAGVEWITDLKLTAIKGEGLEEIS